MRLQNADSAIVTEAKTRGYLLDPEHPQNQGKSRLFAALGYTKENWQIFESDLRAQHLILDAVEGRASEYGVMYEIVGMLRGPLRGAIIKTVWMIDHGTNIPRFITARRP